MFVLFWFKFGCSIYREKMSGLGAKTDWQSASEDEDFKASAFEGTQTYR